MPLQPRTTKRKAWVIPGLHPGLNGAKLRAVWDAFCPAEAIGFNPGFQPWETSNKAVRPARARDRVVQMRSECYRKGIGYLLGRRYSLPFVKIMRTSAELSDCRPSINRSFGSVSYKSDLAPLRARRPGGGFPGLKPWARS